MEPDDTAVPPHAPSIRTVDAARGVEWVSGALRIFMKAPGQWVLAGLALLVAGWVLSALGWIGSAISTMFAMVAMGVVMRACQSLDEGKDLLGEARQSASQAPLWILGLVSAGLSIGMAVLSGLLGVSAFLAGFASRSAGVGMLGIGMLVMVVLWIGLGMALWMAPALVVLRGMGPAQALRASLAGSLRNLVAYLIFSVLAFVACIVAAIPMGLGLLVVLPVLMISSYLAYQDIFVPAVQVDAVGFTPGQ